MNTDETESLLLYYYNELPEDKMLEINELVSQNEKYAKFIEDLKYVEKMYTTSSKSLKVPKVVFTQEKVKKTKNIRLDNFGWIRNIAVAASIMILFTIGSQILTSNDYMSHADVYNVIAFIENLDKEQSVKQARYEDISIEEASGNILIYEGFKDDEQDLRELWVNNF
jgi:hypothetical protein